MKRLLVALGILLFCPPTAWAQLRSQLIVSGLSEPVGFVQDPVLPDTQYVVEQGGTIRVVRAGQLTTTPFLDLRGAISSGGERGLLGLAFAPDYASSGRLFVDFTNVNGDTVIARFRRSTTDPRVADVATRFDLRWPDGNRFIPQPYANHNGGNLQFGPDGDLYVGLGDGGSGNDPENHAQTASSLLGKMLRIDVSVPDSDANGYRVPPDNPFVGRAGYLPEIWDVGLRNPWRYSFDAFGQGATGALVIGDVGQDRYEEIDYEPAAQGGRNWGWRIREGAHDNVTSLPPAFTPLKDPTYEYSHSTGQCVIGGYVYRGAALPASYVGRYFFADYTAARVWMAALALDGAGEATVTNVTDVTAQLGGSNVLGSISSFGIDGSGELYLVGHITGEIRRITSAAPVSRATVTIDTPSAGTLVQPFSIAGWAIDLAQAGSTTGVDSVHTWAIPQSGGQATFLGSSYGLTRADVAAAYGASYLSSGYSVRVSGLADGNYQLSSYAHSSVTNQFAATASVSVSVVSGPALTIEAPVGGSVAARFTVSGWAVDRDSTGGTGVDAIHVWAYPSSGSPRFLGVATYGSPRSDIGAMFGGRFTNSGWTITAAGLTPGAWTIAAFLHSAVTGTFRSSSSVAVQVPAGAALSVDAPRAGAVTGPFTVAGWAIDLASTSGAGISAVHAWAFAVGGSGAPVFLGAATLGLSRQDVGAVFGSQFTPSGYRIAGATLGPGTYDISIYARSALTGRFDATQTVRIVVN